LTPPLRRAIIIDMSDEDPRRGGRAGGVIVALIVGGSAVGVIGWYVLTNRNGPAIDASGFDLSSAPQAHHGSSLAVAPSRPDRSSSSLFIMQKADAGVRIGDSNASSPGGQAASSAKEVDKKEQAHAGFKEQARKHEADVRKFAEMMTRKYPAIRQYGKDWMSHPDLRKLNDDYMRNHDPVAFIMGLTKAPSLGGMVKKYAGSPAIMEFITQGMKEAPGELTSSAMDVLSNDTVAKSLISNVASGLGLPPSITGLINSGGDASKMDQKQVVNDMMNSDAVKNAIPPGQQAPPAVAIPDQR
jgi:hypothetical protein